MVDEGREGQMVGQSGTRTDRWLARALDNCPGFDDPNEAQKWVFNFVKRARRAELACTWPNDVTVEHLDGVADGSVAELVQAAFKAAEAWREATASLKEYQRMRSADVRLNN
jgi:hypothetical protein